MKRLRLLAWPALLAAALATACDNPLTDRSAAGRSGLNAGAQAGPTAVTGKPVALSEYALGVLITVNANGEDASAWLEWGFSPTLADARANSPVPIGAGTAPVTLKLYMAFDTIPPMGTVFYYRAAGSNASGTARGEIRAYTYGPPPVPTNVSGVLDRYHRVIVTADSLYADSSTIRSWWALLRQKPGGALERVNTSSRIPIADNTFDVNVDEYDYYLQACNILFCSSSSAPLKLTGLRLAPPTDLVVASDTPGKVILRWQDNSSTEYGFKVLRRDPIGNIRTFGTAKNVTTVTDTSAQAGVEYAYRVYVRTLEGRTNPGPEVTVVPGGVGTPQAPSAITGRPLTLGRLESTVQIAVAPNGLATQAWLEWGYTPDLQDVRATGHVSVGGGTAAVALTQKITRTNAPPQGTVFYYRAAAANSAGTSRGQIRSLLYGPPPVPTGLSGTLDRLHRAFISLDSATTDPGTIRTRWALLRQKPGGAFEAVTSKSTLPLPDNTFDVTVDRYDYYAQACNDLFCSASSAPLVMTGMRLPPPSNLVVVSDTPQNVVVRWQDNSTTEDRFIITRRETSGVTSLFGTARNGISVRDTSAKAGIQYYYSVRARTFDGRYSSPSAEVGVKPGGEGSGEAPSAVTGRALTLGRLESTVEITVTANGLETQAWLDWGFTPTLSDVRSTTPTSIGTGTTPETLVRKMTLTSAPAQGSVYYYRAAASNSTGTTRGQIRSLVYGPPSVPTGLAGALDSYHRVILRADTANTAPNTIRTRWQLLRRKAGGSVEAVKFQASLPVGDNTFDINADQYDYFLQACNNVFCSASSTPLTLTGLRMPAPTNLVVASSAPGQVVLTWQDNATTEYQYVITRYQPAANTQVHTRVKNTTSFTDTSAQAGVQYTYKVEVKALDGRVASPALQVTVIPGS